ncbi:hypothetical protein [Sorangium sp. So ce1000]|uniref:hypothetical protein n=1 Tax=Sorangium sp. So ce1000 TaxID=3133325 RepID=UPI003F5EA187
MLAATALAALAGCATTSTRIFVDAPSKTNGGAMLYMMVRTAEGTLATESYQDAAAKLFGSPADKQILSSQPIFPGEKVTVTIDGGEKSDVVIYFFFTAPEGDWRLPLPKPLPAEVLIELGEHQIERAQVRRR